MNEILVTKSVRLSVEEVKAVEDFAAAKKGTFSWAVRYLVNAGLGKVPAQLETGEASVPGPDALAALGRRVDELHQAVKQIEALLEAGSEAGPRPGKRPK